MSKYFVRYAYDVINKVPQGIGWTYETTREEESCVLEMEEERVNISNIRDYIHDYEMNWRSNRPDVYGIDILVLNKL